MAAIDCSAIVSILHISDVHFGCADDVGDQDRIISALRSAIGERQERIHCIVFTGDLTQRASYVEFQQGQDWLISLCDSINAPCVMVPGNHDIRREKADKKVLRSAYQDRDSFGRWRDDIFKAPDHVRPFLDWFDQAKEEFSQLVNQWKTNPAIDVVKLSLAGVECQFVCLNTALLSCDDSDDPERGDKKLCVDIKGINGSLKNRIAENTLVLVVGHHPPESLALWNRNALDEILGQATGPHVYFHGHVHRGSNQSAYSGTGSGYFCSSAGAAYPGSEYVKQFTILTVDLGEKIITPTVFKFAERSGLWVIDNELSQPVPARLPKMHSKIPNADLGGRELTRPRRWANPFADVIANGIPPRDIHRLFVEPINSLSKLKNRVETVVEGQRGTGKTMLLRYFSLEVQSSLLQQQSPNTDVIELLNSTCTPFGVYCCLTHAGLNRTDFDSIEHEVRRVSLFDHLSCLFILGRFFSALSTLQKSTKLSEAIGDDLKQFTLRFLRISPGVILSENRYFQHLVREIDIQLDRAKEHVSSLLPGGTITVFNPWLTLSNSLFSMLDEYREALQLKEPFFLLIDDFDQLNVEQQSIFFSAASARRHDTVCYKFGIMSEGQKAYLAGDGRTYREGDDYNFVRLDWVDGGLEAGDSASNYVKVVNAIFERRMTLSEWPPSLTLGGLLDNWDYGKKVREEAKEAAMLDYEQLPTAGRPLSFTSYWAKQGNAKYFRLLADHGVSHRYAGRSAVIELSSGIFRQFLELCSGIVDVALADGWSPATGKPIGAERQHKAIREWSKDMFRSLGSSGDVSNLGKNEHVITSENLINLANSLCRYFRGATSFG
jgi:3',5'-cyclic AMP phosphodiesterase CpdA